ncbi:MAG: L,D-transpeptidase [Nitrospina sp.]|jgi:lipoprotein-anchoring transpeptidase ErfK/SrfK|nr:L,D-transpeptidase [Nitrospina sp.]MBT3415239.1 L,D-transpeptidase [Nitrospina sp.]MBT3857516.1 L,D-transpeptidase [Nitrospina sp.]MBT4103967.1 L,D-transpeptidase [Nitrospina sp.]MBT4388528.1 L,D-transpeptidase [Nitrospina sp.]
MKPENKLTVLNINEYNLIGNKDPSGSYDRKTRENLYWIIEKLRAHTPTLSRLERRLLEKFHKATFGALEEKNKKVKFEVARYRLSNNVKRTLKLVGISIGALIISGTLIYQFVLGAQTRQKVDVAWYQGLSKVGLVSKEEMAQIRQDLTVASVELEETRKFNAELSVQIEQMILNNKVTENLKYILKQVYNNKRASYVRSGQTMTLKYNAKDVASFNYKNPQLWYLLGIVESGALRVYYNDEEIMEIESIFGRAGEETPVGEYEIKNKAYKPTWYKKETLNGKTRVRAIPFGHEDHEIGHWWMGMKRLGDPVPGSYGIHGVNASKVNEFFKKNFDWRNGSAGCPNIQEWYLNFLAKMVPLGTRVNIVQKDKWVKKRDFIPPSSATL